MTLQQFNQYYCKRFIWEKELSGYIDTTREFYILPVPSKLTKGYTYEVYRNQVFQATQSSIIEANNLCEELVLTPIENYAWLNK